MGVITKKRRSIIKILTALMIMLIMLSNLSLSFAKSLNGEDEGYFQSLNTQENASTNQTRMLCTGAYTANISQGIIQNYDVSNDGYSSIFTSGTTGRQFKEFKQNAAAYNYPSLNNSYWEIECGTVVTGIIGSGYKNLTMEDIADELNKNSGETNFTMFLTDFTGQNVTTGAVSSVNDFANALANGSVAVIHDYGYNTRGHYLTVLDISRDKSKVYISNPDINSTGADGISQGWNSINAVYNAIEKNEIYFVTNDGNSIDYSKKEDKIFYIGDSWFVGLKESEKAKSSSDYFYAQAGQNADWVTNTYSNMNIPRDASCVIVEFGLNGLTNWDKTKELINDLNKDYPSKEIFVLQVPHICDGYTVDPDFNSKVDTYNEKMRSFCSEKSKIKFINPTTNIVSDSGRGYLKNEYAVSPNDSSQGGGKMHLNNEGYEVWYNDIISLVTTNNRMGDGWKSTTTVNYPNGIERTYKNYKQYQGSYANYSYWDDTIASSGCGPTSIAIILSGYGIDANPREVVDAFHELGYDYSSMSTIQTILKEKYNIDSEIESLTTSSIQHIRDNFDAGRPVITGVPNHFITYLGEDSNGKIILSDPGYSDRTYGDTIEDYVGTYGNRGFDLLLIKTGSNPLKTTIKNYQVKEEDNIKYLENIEPNLTIENLIENIQTNGIVEIYNGNNKITDNNVKIGTGMTIKIKLNDQEENYQVVVTGDLTGDGQLRMSDILKLARYNARLDEDLIGAYLRAADIIKDENIGMPDVLKLARVIAKLDTLSYENTTQRISYSSLTLSDEDMEILYKLVEAEGGGGTNEQVMYIACTILNRVLSSSFPDSIREVAFASGQFEVTWNGMYDEAVPSQDTKDAVDAAIRTGDTTGGSIGFQNDWLYDSQYPNQTWETPIELLRETWPGGGTVVFFTTPSIQEELNQYKK